MRPCNSYEALPWFSFFFGFFFCFFSPCFAFVLDIVDPVKKKKKWGSHNSVGEWKGFDIIKMLRRKY